MAYTVNPMSQYNKNNPFVILSKQEYDKVMDTLQTLSKAFIKKAVAAVILALMFIGATITSYFIFDQKTFFLILTITILYMVLDGIYTFYYFKIVKFYMYEHEGMMEFDKISNLELNEIQKIGNEEILLCLHKLYSLQGSLKIHVSNLDSIGIILIVTQCFELLIWLSMVIL